MTLLSRIYAVVPEEHVHISSHFYMPLLVACYMIMIFLPLLVVPTPTWRNLASRNPRHKDRQHRWAKSQMVAWDWWIFPTWFWPLGNRLIFSSSISPNEYVEGVLWHFGPQNYELAMAIHLKTTQSWNPWAKRMVKRHHLEWGWKTTTLGDRGNKSWIPQWHVFTLPCVAVCSHTHVYDSFVMVMMVRITGW